MHNLQIFSFTLMLLVALFIFLSVSVSLQRHKHRVPYAQQLEDRQFLATISAERNFSEYTPINLLLLSILMHIEAPIYLFLTLNIALVLGRYIHAFGILCTEQWPKPSFVARQIGMLLTLTVLMISTVSIFVLAARY